MANGVGGARAGAGRKPVILTAVEAELRKGGGTVRDLSEVLPFAITSIQDAVYELVKRGIVRRMGKAPHPGGHGPAPTLFELVA